MATLVKRLAYLTIGVAAALCRVTVAAAATAPAPLALCGAEAALTPQTATRPHLASAQVRRVEKADITFSVTTTLDGAVQVEGRGGDLVFRKKVYENGGFTLEMEAPRDKVAISFAEHSIRLTRDRKTLTITPATASDEELDKVRRLLADSRAARLIRVAAAAVQDSEDDSASSAALLIGDALVGMLTGDAGAPGRIARHLARRARSRVRPVSFQIDCYNTWEQRVFRASYEWEDCVRDFSVWNPTRNLCAVRWILQVESYWFSFMTCSGWSTL